MVARITSVGGVVASSSLVAAAPRACATYLSAVAQNDEAPLRIHHVDRELESRPEDRVHVE